MLIQSAEHFHPPVKVSCNLLRSLYRKKRRVTCAISIMHPSAHGRFSIFEIEQCIETTGNQNYLKLFLLCNNKNTQQHAEVVVMEVCALHELYKEPTTPWDREEAPCRVRLFRHPAQF